MSECKCSMSISVLGDGCRYCQPQEYIDQLADALEDTIDTTDHAEELMEKLERVLFEAKQIPHYRRTPDLVEFNFKVKRIVDNYREATK
jgi:hypothetical protein